MYTITYKDGLSEANPSESFHRFKPLKSFKPFLLGALRFTQPTCYVGSLAIVQTKAWVQVTNRSAELTTKPEPAGRNPPLAPPKRGIQKVPPLEIGRAHSSTPIY